MSVSFKENQESQENPLHSLLWKYRWLERSRLAYLITFLIASFMTWAWFAELEKFSLVTGQVIPQEKIKVIQHLEGGIVEEINVDIGSVVDVDQVLFRINLAGSERKEELEAEFDGYLLKRARLEAELNNKELKFSPDIVSRRPRIAQAETIAYNANVAKLKSTLEVFGQRRIQRQQELREIDAKLDSSRRELALQKESLALKENLFQKGLISRVEFLDLKTALERIQGRVKELEEVKPSAASALKELDANVQEIHDEFTSRAATEVVATDNLLEQARISLGKATDKDVRRDVRSPIAGVVKKLYFNTLGGVIRPGEPIMEIVPISENLVIEGRLPPADRGFVRLNQKAIVKISAYDFLRYGGLEGRVEHISADTLTDEQGQTYFQVYIRTDQTWLGDQKGDLPITPGMEVSADIHTDDRTVLQYMFKPVFKLKSDAFRE